jgi:hypothetical protein
VSALPQTTVPAMKTATATRNAGLRPVTVASSLESGWAKVIPSRKVVLKLRVSERLALTSAATIWKVPIGQPSCIQTAEVGHIQTSPTGQGIGVKGRPHWKCDTEACRFEGVYQCDEAQGKEDQQVLLGSL